MESFLQDIRYIIAASITVSNQFMGWRPLIDSRKGRNFLVTVSRQVLRTHQVSHGMRTGVLLAGKEGEA